MVYMLLKEKIEKSENLSHVIRILALKCIYRELLRKK